MCSPVLIEKATALNGKETKQHAKLNRVQLAMVLRLVVISVAQYRTNTK